MQKTRFIITLLIAFALVMSSVTTAKASGPTGSWISGIACQNLDSANQAIVTLTFYREGSSTEAIHYDSFIDIGASKNWLTTSTTAMPGFPTNFIGSGVISSSTALACNVNTQSTGVGTTTSPYRLGTNAGFNDVQVAPTMYVPQVLKAIAGWNSYMAVQNTANAAVTVNVAYFNADGSTVAAAGESTVIPAQSTKVFYQEDNAGLPVGFNGGAKVSAVDGTSGLAVGVALYQSGTDYTKAQFLSYNGFGGGADKVFGPRVVKNVAGNNTGIAVQNVGTAPVAVTMTFSFPGLATPIVMTQTVNVNASWVSKVTLPVFAPVALLTDRQGSVVIEAPGGSIVANINEDNQDPASGARMGQGSTYNAVLSGQESTTVFFSQFVKGAAGFYSGFQVSNTTGTAGTCDIEYTAQPAINENDVALAANGTILRYSGSRLQTSMLNMVLGYNAAVKVTCTVPVTGIVNMSVPNKYGDSFTQTTGLNQ